MSNGKIKSNKAKESKFSLPNGPLRSSREIESHEVMFSKFLVSVNQVCFQKYQFLLVLLTEFEKKLQWSL